MSFKTIGQVAAFKPLARHNMEELAARQLAIKPSGGILFERASEREQKNRAREHILSLFDPQEWPERLHMLTMPGIHWRFERLLLGRREVGWMKTRKPRRTFFTCVENDRALYFAGVTQMPGLHTPHAVVKPLRTFSFAEQGVKTKYASFFFANVDQFMEHNWDQGYHENWGAAWLDYTGPMTPQRLKIIAEFYKRHISKILIVTVLTARYRKETVAAIDRAGGHSEWLRKYLPGDVLHDIKYNDTGSPMAQFAIRKTGD